MNAAAQRPARGPWRIFRWPLAIAALSLFGLLAALLGEGWQDAVSSLCLGALIPLMIRCYRR